jgi:hypothetical protein
MAGCAARRPRGRARDSYAHIDQSLSVGAHIEPHPLPDCAHAHGQDASAQDARDTFASEHCQAPVDSADMPKAVLVLPDDSDGPASISHVERYWSIS